MFGTMYSPNQIRKRRIRNVALNLNLQTSAVHTSNHLSCRQICISDCHTINPAYQGVLEEVVE